MINTFLLTSIGLYLVLNLSLSLSIYIYIYIYLTLNSTESAQYKEANNIVHPISIKLNDAYDVSDEHSFQIEVGSKIMPEYPMTSVTEALYQLRKTVGNPLYIYIYIYIYIYLYIYIYIYIYIYGRWYRSHKYIIGLDMEKISGAGFTGLSTKAGDQLTINFKDCDAGNFVNSIPTRMFCVLNYDCVLSIADNGITLLD